MTSTVFKKVLLLCKRNNILTIEQNNNVIKSIKYGPLGYLIKSNIYREWLSFCMNHPNAHILPVNIQESSIITNNECIESSKPFLREVREQYQAILPQVSDSLPVGLAINGICATESSELDSKAVRDNEETGNLLWNFKQWSYQALVFFCDAKQSFYWFHFWQRQRYVWWRRFSCIPSQFLLTSEVTSNEDKDDSVSIQFQFPWSVQTLENIKVLCNSHLKLPLTEKSDKDSFVPNLILCESNLDLAVFMYIYNSFQEKWFKGNVRMVLRLHHKLAPYKASVVVHSTNAEAKIKLINVSNRLVLELKQKGVSVFPSLNNDLIESEFERFDEIGIPYTIVLSENSLVTGTAGLRNRDTTLDEQVHITEITEKVITYLLMTVPVENSS